MSRKTTRQSAADLAAKPGNNLVLDHDARGPGVREWCSSGALGARAVVFYTRIKAPAWLTGQAAKGIARQLRPGEETRARGWVNAGRHPRRPEPGAAHTVPLTVPKGPVDPSVSAVAGVSVMRAFPDGSQATVLWSRTADIRRLVTRELRMSGAGEA